MGFVFNRLCLSWIQDYGFFEKKNQKVDQEKKDQEVIQEEKDQEADPVEKEPIKQSLLPKKKRDGDEI